MFKINVTILYIASSHDCYDMVVVLPSCWGMNEVAVQGHTWHQFHHKWKGAVEVEVSGILGATYYIKLCIGRNGSMVNWQGINNLIVDSENYGYLAEFSL